VTAHHDHRHRQLAGGAPLLEQADAIDVGHPDVEQHEVGPHLLARGARLRRVLGHLDRMTFVGQDLRQQRADADFVIDDEDRGHVSGARPLRSH
jgi:hypothetical protein